MEEVTVRLNKESGAEEIRLRFPQKWDELTPQQLLYVSKYYFSWVALIEANESMAKAKALLLLELCGLSSRSEKVRLCKMLALVDEATNFNILSLTDFIIIEKMTLTRNLLPRIKVGLFTWFHGPDDRLKDISIGEFSFAFGCYQLYMRTRVEMHLDNLVAILYRPANPDYKTTGEIKIPFGHKKIDLYMGRIRKLDEKYKVAVLLFFMGCMEALGKQFPEIFRKAVKEEKAGGSFFDTVRQMSGGKFGHFANTQETNLYLFLQEMQELIRQIEKDKKRK